MDNLVNRLFSKMERSLCIRWFNPFATLYFNLRCLPIKQALRLPVWIFGRPKFIELRGKIEFKCPLKSRLIEINNTYTEAPSFQGNQTEILLRGVIIFKGFGNIGAGNKIYIGKDAILELGDKFKIADYCNIGCSRYIKLGNYCRLAHRGQILDSNYHFLANINKNIIPPTIKEIYLGNHVWIGNSTTISGGALIPDYTIVAANSLVNKNFNHLPEYSLIGGIPAKFIASGFRRVEDEKMTAELYEYYRANSGEIYKLRKEYSDEIFEHE